jgi:hypothetical protein
MALTADRDEQLVHGPDVAETILSPAATGICSTQDVGMRWLEHPATKIESLLIIGQRTRG